MTQFIRILSISRPRFWLYLAGPYLVGYAFMANRLMQFDNWVFWYGLFFFLLPANFILYGLNDVADADTDKHNKKKQTKEIAFVASDKLTYVNIIYTSLLLSVPLLFFLTPISRVLLICFLFLAAAYSLAPIRLKAKPVVDSVSNILYAFPAFIAAYQFPNADVPLEVFVAALCWTAAMHLFSAIPDIEPDSKAGLKTSAILLGKKNSLFACTVLWAITAILVLPFAGKFFVFAIYPLITFAALFIEEQLSLDTIYWLFPYINAIVGFYIFLVPFLQLI